MKTLTYLPVNWVNGLKLTSQHFFANLPNRSSQPRSRKESDQL